LGGLFLSPYVFVSIVHSLIGSVLENNLLTYHFCSKYVPSLLIELPQQGKVEAYQRLSILVAPPLFGD